MKLLVLYATTEGQTRKIVRFVADRLAEAGHTVELLPAAEAKELDLARFDRALVAGSVHGGAYQADLVDSLTAHRATLAGLPTLFLSVSLTAAGDDPEDWDGLKACVARLTEDTGWTPGRVVHVAGAFRFTQYDFFKAWAMRWIARERDETIDPNRDKEYTDWDKLARDVDDWLET